MNSNKPYSNPVLSAQTLRVLEAAPNSYLVLSPDLYILTASDMYLEATETSREAIVGKHIFEAFPDNPSVPDIEGVQTVKFSIEEALRTKQRHHLPVTRYDVPDPANPGKFIQKYWHPSHTPVLDKEGKVQFIIQLANDVTDRILLEKALENAKIEKQQTLESMQGLNQELVRRAHSERHFKQLADLVPGKISNALPTGEVTYLNRQWLEYTGMSSEDMRDFGYREMMHPDETEHFAKRLAEAAQKREPLEMEIRCRNAKGEYRWQLTIASPILGENGEIKMWVGSTTDIHKIKEEEQRKTDFIAMVSHELKTPLTSLSGYLQLLYNKAGRSADNFMSTAMEKSLQHVRKMTSLINGFLNVSRLEHGKIVINKTRFDLVALIKEIIEDVQLTMLEQRIKLTNVESLSIEADREKIESVISNLISNAIKYSPSGNSVLISCKKVGNTAQVSIEDDGMGISKQDLERLFERFYRVSNHQTKHISGFGIGLYVSAEIIERHSGKIWAESEVGKGSTFYFSIPVVEQFNHD